MAWHLYRFRTTLVTVLSAGTISLIVAVLSPEIGSVAAAATGCLGAALAGGVAWIVLAPITRLSALAAEVASGQREPQTLPEGRGELVGFTAAIQAIEAKRSELSAQYQVDLTVVADALAKLADARNTPELPPLVSPFPGSRETLKTHWESTVRELVATRQRVAWATRVLATLPDAIAIADGTGALRYVNPSAEKLFGCASSPRGSAMTLFGDSGSRPNTGTDPAFAIAERAQVIEWLRAGASGKLVTRSANGRLVEVCASVPPRQTRDAVLVITARDVSDTWDAVQTDRPVIRANATRQLLDRYLTESSEPLISLAAQLRLLSGDAKQSGMRDAMTAKVSAAQHSLRRLETYHTLMQWFRTAVWSELPEPTPSEFMPAEVVTAVGDKLATRFKMRGNALKVVDQGGWMFADLDRLDTALTGLLLHASEATANTQLELRITRLPVALERPIPFTEFYLPDAGPVISPEELAVVERPFGGAAPSSLDQFEGIGGFPLGLVVAARLATGLDGELHLETGTAGQLGVRLIVPTRRAVDGPTMTVAAIAPGALDVAPTEETVAGWRLGAPAPQMPA